MVLYFQRDATVPGSTMPLALVTMPGMLGLMIGANGLLGAVGSLAVAHVFPMYWLGLGMRSALLPDSAAAVEIGGSWRPGMTMAVLIAWSVAGLLIAPPVLCRMARRESGSAVQARRDRALQRIG
ncbi:hypothetical protein [Nonomuraea cavernae]|uniref:hypothetical protein n=1 Tax=Nonomuraea cavernae TaxID=2045107 RepID=UPI0033D9F264